jgi:hypothetical protein
MTSVVMLAYESAYCEVSSVPRPPEEVKEEVESVLVEEEAGEEQLVGQAVATCA